MDPAGKGTETMAAMTYDEMAKACYELYKTDWENTHLTDGEKDAARTDYEQGIKEDADFSNLYPTFEDYLFDVGYDGSLYACYAEFLDAEFADEAYMMGLLDGHGELKEAWESLR